MRNLLLLMLAVPLLSACWHCQNEVVQKLPSPSGQYEVVVKKAGCDVSTGLYQRVSVSRVGVPNTSKPQRCGAPGTEIVGFEMDNNQTVALHWRSDSVLVASVHGNGASGRSKRGLGTCGLDHSVTIVFE